MGGSQSHTGTTRNHPAALPSTCMIAVPAPFQLSRELHPLRFPCPFLLSPKLELHNNQEMGRGGGSTCSLSHLAHQKGLLAPFGGKLGMQHGGILHNISKNVYFPLSLGGREAELSFPSPPTPPDGALLQCRPSDGEERSSLGSSGLISHPLRSTAAGLAQLGQSQTALVLP